MAQGKPHSARLWYRASLALSMRPPTTIPLDPMQQRLLKALENIRTVASEKYAETLIRGFENEVEKAAGFHGAIADAVRMPIPGVDVSEEKATEMMQLLLDRLAATSPADAPLLRSLKPKRVSRLK
jgi:hypothetical protein